MPKNNFTLICMSFDGDFVTEGEEFETINDAWDRSADMGSRWYFYPFHFVTNGLTVLDTPDQLEFLKHKRVSTIKKIFAAAYGKEITQGFNCDQFVNYLISQN